MLLLSNFKCTQVNVSSWMITHLRGLSSIHRPLMTWGMRWKCNSILSFLMWTLILTLIIINKSPLTEKMKRLVTTIIRFLFIMVALLMVEIIVAKRKDLDSLVVVVLHNTKRFLMKFLPILGMKLMSLCFQDLWHHINSQTLIWLNLIGLLSACNIKKHRKAKNITILSILASWRWKMMKIWVELPQKRTQW